jgi:3-hydroxyacyl-CoA dehydrogenase
MSVTCDMQGGVAVLTLKNPPVNALSVAVRQGLLDGLQKVAADPAVTAVVIMGAGRTFPCECLLSLQPIF